MKIGSGGQEASHVALRGEKQLSYSKHHGFIQICYFELNVISELLWNELPFTHCLTHNTCGGEKSEVISWKGGKKKKIIMMRSSRAWGGLRRCSKGAWWGVEGGACVELRGKPKGRGVVIWQSYLSIKQANLPSVAALVFRSVAYTDPVALICDHVSFIALNLISTAWKRVEVTLGYGDESQHVIWRSD